MSGRQSWPLGPASSRDEAGRQGVGRAQPSNMPLIKSDSSERDIGHPPLGKQRRINKAGILNLPLTLRLITKTIIITL